MAINARKLTTTIAVRYLDAAIVLQKTLRLQMPYGAFSA